MGQGMSGGETSTYRNVVVVRHDTEFSYLVSRMSALIKVKSYSCKSSTFSQFRTQNVKIDPLF